MKIFRKSIVILLVLALCLSMFTVGSFAAQPGMQNFTEKNEYYEGLFTDIGGTWFEGSVARGYVLGLINGKGNGVYEPYANVTLAEAIKLAACIHSIYNTGEANFKQGSPWYQVYVNYCFTKGILQSGYPDYNAYATRTQFAQIFASALPAAALPAINTVDDNAIPDVKMGDPGAADIYKLYRAGILTGSDDKGTFKPTTNILRSEMAAIVTRMADMNVRRTVTLTNGNSSGGAMNAEQIAAKCSSSVFYIEVYDARGQAFASGSGVFISSDGRALTNHHVMDGAHYARIWTTDGNSYDVTGYYDAIEAIDLALIQINGSGFDYLEMADVSTIAAGQTVFAIGSPLGLDNTISQGIISNVNRVIDGLGYIQTTAPISHGSSGGALINDRGQLIGITSAGFEDGQNLNLAVPINRYWDLDSSTLKSLPVGSGAAPAPNPGTGYGAYLSFTDQLSLTVGNNGSVSIYADPGSFAGTYYLSYQIADPTIATASWGSWSGNYINLYVNGIKSGSTYITISMYDDATDALLCTSTLYVTVSGGSNNNAGFYPGHYPAPDFGYYTGTPLYYQEDGIYFYRAIDMSDVDWCLDYYQKALTNQGFEYWKTVTDSWGDPIIYYVNRSLDLYVYMAINYIGGYECLEVCAYYGYEVP